MYTQKEIEEQDTKIRGIIKELEDMTYPIGTSGQNAYEAIQHLGSITNSLRDIIQRFKFLGKNKEK